MPPAMLMIKRFELDFIEILAMLCCYDYCPETAYYFITATTFLYQHGFSEFGLKKNQRPRGILFGYELLQVVRGIFRLESPGRSNVGTMYTRYQDCEKNMC